MATAIINWGCFGIDVRNGCRLHDIKGRDDLWRAMGKKGKQTAYRAYDGESVGVVTFLKLCKWFNLNPFDYYMER